MKRVKRTFGVIGTVAALVLMSMTVNATEVKTIDRNEVLPKSQFLAATDISNDGTVNGDLFAAGKMVSSTGKITGDLIAGAQSLRSSGTVNGDILCGAGDIDISGKVGGNIRCAGRNVAISGSVGKNVNVFASNAAIQDDALINGNLLAFGEYVKVQGTVRGYTKIDGKRITLGGEFFGDVDINLESPNRMNLHKQDWGDDTYVTILSGTVIHGKLTYKSPRKAHIESGAQVPNAQWLEIKDKTVTSKLPNASETVRSLFKLVLSTAVYFLVAMLLFRLLPGTFRQQSELIAEHPFRIMGIGLLGIVSILGTLIVLVLLIALSVLFSAPMVSVVFGLLALVSYTVLFYLATIPVAMWLGNRLLGDRYNIPARFAVGLSIISIIIFVLKYFGHLPAAGPWFGFLIFVTVLVIMLAGLGALLVAAKDLAVSVRRHEVTR